MDAGSIGLLVKHGRQKQWERHAGAILGWIFDGQVNDQKRREREQDKEFLTPCGERKRENTV